MKTLEKTNAKLFIFCFPFKMFLPFTFLSSLSFGLGDVASFLFLAIGMILIFCKGKIIITRRESGKLFLQFISMYVICDFFSLVMSLLLYKKCGVIAGETTILASLKKILYSFAYILFVFYSREIGRILTKEEIVKTLNKCIDCCIVIGLIQIIFINGISVAGKIYNIFNGFFGAWNLDNILLTKRVALLAKEPSYSAGFLVIIVFPFLLSKQVMNKASFIDFIRFVFSSVILYYTKSTIGYGIFVVFIVSSAVIYFNRKDISFEKKIIYLTIFCTFIILLFVLLLRNTIVINVFDKLLSDKNQDSTDRKAIFYVDLSIFFHYPILGVGNGNQGFFYRKFVPTWALQSYTGINAYRKASNVLFDGGGFWISFLSGYGILGLILLVAFFVKSIKILKKYKSIAGIFYYMYIFSLPVIIIDGLAATLGEMQYMWFIISIPIMIEYWCKNNSLECCGKIEDVNRN